MSGLEEVVVVPALKAVVTAASSAASSTVLQAIDRRREGRALSRKELLVYVPGTGNALTFRTTDALLRMCADAVRDEPLLKTYLEKKVIDLGELASALAAFGVVPREVAAKFSKGSVMVLGSTKVEVKLLGILNALNVGDEDFLKPMSAEDVRIPWELLRREQLPLEALRRDGQLLEIWFALHCEYIFDVPPGRIVPTSWTCNTIRRMDPSLEHAVVEARGGVKMFFEASHESLRAILRDADAQHLTPSPIAVEPALRVAVALGGKKLRDLLRQSNLDVAASVSQTLRDACRLIFDKGFKIVTDGDDYCVRAEVSQARATQDLDTSGAARHVFRLRLHPCDEYAIFETLRTFQGGVYLLKPVAKCGQYFTDPATASKVCEHVDRAMTLLGVKTGLSDPAECRLNEVCSDRDLVAEATAMQFTDDLLSRCHWATTPTHSSLLELDIDHDDGPEVVVAVDSFASMIEYEQVRLKNSEPDYVVFVNVLGADLTVTANRVTRPLGRGFKDIDPAEEPSGYAYRLVEKNYSGRYKKIRGLGVWRCDHATITHVSDGPGYLG